MIFALFCCCFSINVVYGASLQIKSVYTKNRITVTTDSAAAAYGDAEVFASRPPYNDGWLWTIEPDEENASLARTSVMCGASIALSSTITGTYISVENGGVVALPSNQGTISQWQVTCESGNVWTDEVEITLMNLRNKCFLGTNLDAENGKFKTFCGPLQKGSIWRAAEGIYFSDSLMQHSEKRNANEELIGSEL